ncbi:MAG: recombinase family protein [Candidatus Saccharibacteria bacterium]
MDQQFNAVILARVSSKSQEDEGYSLDSQLKLLQGYCENKDLKVVKVFKIAETASKEQSRKVFHELLAYISKNNIYHLAIEKTDRFTRNFRDAVAIDDWLETDDNRRLHAVKENLLLHKNAKSDVKFMWNIHISVAKKYTDNLREEAMKGWAEKLAQGWLPSVPPPGYITIVEGGKRIHVPDPATTSLMQEIFKKYIEPNHSIASVAEEMKLMGITTRKGRPYAKSQVQKILTNPFYIGINRFNGKDYPGAQEPIISKDLFEKVQHKMHKGRPLVYVRHNPPLKSLIRCEDCGTAVTWQLQKGRYYGVCKRRSETCKTVKLLREDRVEQMIVEMLEKLICPSPAIIDWVANAMREHYQDTVEGQDRLQASIQLQIDRIKRMDEGLYDDKLSGDIPQAKYEEKHQQFTDQLTELGGKLSKLDNSLSKSLQQRLVLLELSQKAAGIYCKKSPDQKRLIISKLFADVTLKGGALSVKYTNFARAIAENVLETRKLMEVTK